MARKTFRATLGANLGDGQFTVSAGQVRNPSDDVTTAVDALAVVTAAEATVAGADQTAVEAAVALLEADAAAPTQAHVTALRGVWDTMKTDITAVSTAATSTALTAAAASTAGDLQVSYDAAVVTSFNAFRRLVDALLRQVRSSGMV